MTKGPPRDDLLSTLLGGSDVSCPVCAYNLRGLNSTTCPECGASLQLQVGSSDLKLGPWLVALLGLALPLGFVGLSTLFTGAVMIVIAKTQGGLSAGALRLLLLPAALTTAYALVLWRLIRRRRKFWARPRAAQRQLAFIYAILGIGLLLLYVALRWLWAFYFSLRM